MLIVAAPLEAGTAFGARTGSGVVGAACTRGIAARGGAAGSKAAGCSRAKGAAAGLSSRGASVCEAPIPNQPNKSAAKMVRPAMPKYSRCFCVERGTGARVAE